MSLIALWLLIQQPDTGAQVVLGQQQAQYAIYDPPESFDLPNYRNNGFSQNSRRLGNRIHAQVLVHTKPLTTKTKASPVSRLPEGFGNLESRLNALSGQPVPLQVEVLFDWLRTHVRPETDYVADQSLEKVLQTHQANCVGLANTAIFVLEHMSIKARHVTGMVFQSEDKAKRLLEGAVLHRWIEIFYPDVGWVFADPGGKVNHVEASYLVIGISELHPLKQWLESAVGLEVELLSLRDGLQVIARLNDLQQGLRIRPNRLYLKP